MKPRILKILAVFAAFLVATFAPASARAARPPNGFVVPAGLESAVEFWKKIFARHDSTTVLLFDPFDHATIYQTLKAADSPDGRVSIEKERRRILTDYDLDEEMGRVRVQRGAREQFLSGLRIAGRYLPEMKTIFRGAGMPTDLAYLPLVESSFNLNARSPVGAAGIWQFMPETGRKFLRIDDTIDERLDPIASTRAAARLLKENFQILGSWPLAITAYNHGTEGIFRAIEETGSRDLAQIIRRYKSPSFGFASQNFYAEFLAVVDLAKNSERNFPSLRPDQPTALREIALPRPLPLQPALRSASLTSRQFYQWNPALNPSVQTLRAGFKVWLAPEKSDSFFTVQKAAIVKTQSKSENLHVSSKSRPAAARVESKNKTGRAAIPAQKIKATKGGKAKGESRPVQLAQR
jgi:membrane-bound lytic murein transglycosylase D